MSEVVSLFPYQIKNVNNFLFRDHPKDLNPKSVAFKNYWTTQFERIIEGLWVNDEGTYVYMPPKLYFYINLAEIEDEERNPIQPRLRDIEWIIFTYILCCIGFSGFEGDPLYTSHRTVGRIEAGDKLTPIQIGNIPPSAKMGDGSYKKYVDSWHYLTRHYLVDNPPDKPLGLPLYENDPLNMMTLSARGCGKSLSFFVGDFIHEFITSGVKYLKDANKTTLNRRLLFGMGSGDARQLKRSILNIKSFYDSMPGQYRYPNGKVYMGPFYKKTQGSWEVGSEIQHIVKKRDGTTDILGSSIQMVALTADRKTVGAGDRFKRVYIEEVGFQSDLLAVHSANKDSLKVGGKRVGSAVYIGTGGNLEAIKQPKKIFESPTSYDIYGIPNYWKNPRKKIGLFIPAYYQNEDYKDENGNTFVDMSYNECIRIRKKLMDELDSVSYDSEVMFNPLKPDDMLRSGSGGILPRQEANEQLARIEADDLFERIAMVGSLVVDPLTPRGVEFKKDLHKKLRPLKEWAVDDSKVDVKGAFIMYEQPPDHIPANLYWVVYDPARLSGPGESMHSVIVYKYVYLGDEETMYDTIVAEWIGRFDTLEENFQMVIKIAKYFNAKIFPEINEPGFVEYCNKNKHWNLLEADAFFLEQEISPGRKRNYYKVGFQMTGRNKSWAIKKLRDWLLEAKRFDPISKLPIIKTMDWIYSPRILDEIRNYNLDDNFDHISSLLGLMLLIGKLDNVAPIKLDSAEKEEDSLIIKYTESHQIQNQYADRCEFLNY